MFIVQHIYLCLICTAVKSVLKFVDTEGGNQMDEMLELVSFVKDLPMI